MDQEMHALEQRLQRLEATVARLVDHVRLSTEPSVTSPVAPVSAAPVPTMLDRATQPLERPVPAFTTAPPLLDRPQSTAESFLGGRVLLAVGALTMLLGIGFFIKYAFDNGWVGPLGRVAIGVLAGVGAIAGGLRLRSRSAPFGQGIVGLGAAILYLSLYAAGNGFDLVPTSVSFVLMGAVTAALIALALGTRSQTIALFGVVGGFITPALNTGGSHLPRDLFGYLALLDAVLVFVPVGRRWTTVAVSAFVLTQLYVLAGFIQYDSKPMADFIVFQTIFFVLFIALPARAVVAPAGRRTVDAVDAILAIGATGALYATLHIELYDHHRLWLVAATVGLAALFLVAARVGTGRARTLCAGIALALVTGGVAVAFTGGVVMILWTLEGALLVALGVRYAMPLLRGFGFVGIVLAVLAFAAFPPDSGAPFFNERFFTLAALASGFFIIRAAYARGEEFESGESAALPVSEAAAHIAMLIALSSQLTIAFNNEIAITLFWLVYAASLIAYGTVRAWPFARWEGFALLGLALLKAFLVDMTVVSSVVRIVSFLALGSVTLIISYLYLRATKPPGTP